MSLVMSQKTCKLVCMQLAHKQREPKVIAVVLTWPTEELNDVRRRVSEVVFKSPEMLTFCCASMLFFKSGSILAVCNNIG